jgi:uncharacterized protein with HEPN domain
MDPDTRACLTHIEAAIRRVIAFTRGVTYEQYLAEQMRCSAVEREFIIVGEAFRRLERQDVELAERIDRRRRSIRLRNALVHRYERVHHQIVWSAVRNRIPPLLTQVQALLRDAPAQ